MHGLGICRYFEICTKLNFLCFTTCSANNNALLLYFSYYIGSKSWSPAFPLTISQVKNGNKIQDLLYVILKLEPKNKQNKDETPKNIHNVFLK